MTTLLQLDVYKSVFYLIAEKSVEKKMYFGSN